MERMAVDCQYRAYKDIQIKKTNTKKEARKKSNPRTGRGPEVSRKNELNDDIGYHLYQKAIMGKEKQRARQELTEEFYRQQRERKKTTNMSDLIMESLFNKKIKALFSELDSDSDGLISASRICVDMIEARKLKILAPLLIEMENLSLVLDFEAFKDAVKKLTKVTKFGVIFYNFGV